MTQAINDAERALEGGKPPGAWPGGALPDRTAPC